MSDDPWIKALSTYSSTREAVLEHRFLADVCSELWRREIFDFVVSRSEVDNSGYDVILEANGIVRHVQLKGLRIGGKRAEFDIQLRLAQKPSACVIVMLHDARTLAVQGYRWLGSSPGLRIGSLGERLVHHTKGDSTGFKAERPALRQVKLSAFETVPDLTTLVLRLFGAV